MKTLLRMAGLMAILGALPLAAPAWAHHSFAMFDSAKTVTFDGTVKEFDWTNPHAILWVISNPQGDKAAQTWPLELTSPGNLTRVNWNKRIFKAGDKVRVVVHPLRSGEPGGSFVDATFVDTGLKSPPLGKQTVGAAPEK